MTREEEKKWEEQHKEMMRDMYKTLREEGIYIYPDGRTEE